MPKNAESQQQCAALAAVLAEHLIETQDCVHGTPSGLVTMSDGEEQPTGFSFEMADGRVLAVQVTELRGPRRFARKDPA